MNSRFSAPFKDTLPPILPAILTAVLCTFPALAQTPAPRFTIAYARVDTTDLKLDLYLPAARSDAGKPHPLIVWIHGGGWRGGSRTDEIPALKLLDSGFAVASIDYRLSQQAEWPAQILDCKAAVRWLRAHAGAFDLDTARVVAWGASAGGQLASMLGVTGTADGFEGEAGEDAGVAAGSDRVDAVIDYYGASNFLEPIPKRWTRGSAVGQLLGCAVPKCMGKALRASPVHYVDSQDAPFLIAHGTADSVVPFSQGLALDSALRANRVPVAFMPLAGAGHGGPAFTADSTLARVNAFLTETFRARERAAKDLAIRSAEEGLGKTE